MFKSIVTLGLAMLCAGSTFANETQNTVPAAEALKRLQQGNQRFTQAKLAHPHQDAQTRQQLAQAQHPFAIVVCCSDSREVPELIFDQGLGDLFVIRLAGNIIDDAALGSIEYAAAHLGCELVLVLGHERCGAVKATIEGKGHAEGHINGICEAIHPAVEQAKKQDGGTLLDNSIKANALQSLQQIKTSQPIIAPLIAKGKLQVKAAVYDLDDGKVSLLD